MKKARDFSCYLLVPLLAFISFSAFAQESRKLEKIRVAASSRSATYFPIVFAKKQGLYLRQGLDFELILMSPAVSTQTLLSGDIDFSTVFNRDLTAAVRGMPVRLVMALNTGPTFVLVVKPEIRTMKDLKGKTLAIDGARQTLDVLTRKGLEKYGLVPEVDVKLLPMLGAGSDVRLAALLAGRIDGSLLGVPHSTMAVKQGYVVLFAGKDVSQMSSAGMSTTIQKIQKNPDAIVRTIRGTLEGVRFLKKNIAEFTKLLAEETRIKDPETASQVYEDWASLASETGILSDTSLSESIALVKGTQSISREVSVSDVADWRFSQAAVKELEKK